MRPTAHAARPPASEISGEERGEGEGGGGEGRKVGRGGGGKEGRGEGSEDFGFGACAALVLRSLLGLRVHPERTEKALSAHDPKEHAFRQGPGGRTLPTCICLGVSSAFWVHFGVEVSGPGGSEQTLNGPQNTPEMDFKRNPGSQRHPKRIPNGLQSALTPPCTQNAFICVAQLPVVYRTRFSQPENPNF